MISCNTKNGQIFICSHCQKIHLEFGNFTIDFPTLSHLKKFAQHLNDIDGQYYETRNQQTAYRRKIIIPMPGSDLKMIFTNAEIEELCSLLRSFITRQSRTIAAKFDFSNLIQEHLN